MSEQRSDVGFIELDLEDRPPDESARFYDPDGTGRAKFHDLSPNGTPVEIRPDGTVVETDLLPNRVAELVPWHRRTLRIALAMKGGLSLAVWIGGSVAELDILRRIRLFEEPIDGDEDRTRCRAILLHKTDDAERRRKGADLNLVRRAGMYARLLRSHGYDRVEFDVLAGASAGGLNGVLYAVAQRAGVGFDTMLDTWLEAGSAWGLLQTGDPSRYDSVMRGDGYFWPQLSHEILKIIECRDPVSPLRSDQVVVDLSATLLDAVDSSDRTTAEGRAQFRFVGGRDVLDDRAVPPRHAGPLDARDFADIARIAYAARSTSSFPFIFEPALIYSGRDALAGGHGWDALPDPCVALDAPDMRMVFNAHREDAPTHPFRVADGGILDNIPIDRALNAVRNMPADEHSNRAILYLDPSPKETAALFRRPTSYASSRPTLLRSPAANGDDEPTFRADTAAVRDDVGSRVVSTIVAALRKRSARESRDDEIEEVDLVRATTSVAKARNELLADRIDGNSLDAEDERRAAIAYAGYRALSDFELLAPPLLHPGEWLLGTDLAQRPELLALDRLSIVHVEAAFRNDADKVHAPASDPSGRAERTTDPAATARGHQALVDATMAVLSWIRAIEQTAFQDGVLKALDLEFTQELAPPPLGDDDPRHPLPPGKSTADRLPTDAPRALVRRKLSRVIREATLERDTAILATLELAKDRMNARRAGGTLSPAAADEVVQRWIAADARGDERLDRAWAELDDIVVWLLHVSHSIMPKLADQRWSRTPWSKLTSHAAHPLTARQLPLLFGGSGIPQPISSVRFHRIGSDVQPARPLEYRRLMEDQLLRGYRAALAHRARELDAVTVGNLLDEQNLRSTAKLAGLRAANIAGFMSRDWRLNDWWWGRLDAASGIVEFFSSLPPAPQPASTAESEPIAAASSEADVLLRVHEELLAQLVAHRSKYVRDDVADTDEDEADDNGAVLTLPPRPESTGATATRERFVRGTQGFDALSDSYRVAIVSRTLRAASSALTHGERITSPKRFLHWLLRPIAVLLPAFISVPRLILLGGLLAATAVTIWPMASLAPEPPRLDEGMITAWIFTGGVMALIIIRIVAAFHSKRQHDARVLAHTGTRRWTREVIAWAEWRAKRGRIVLVTATLLLAAALGAVLWLYSVDEVLYWVALVAFIAVGEATAHAAQTVPVSLAPKRAAPIAFAVLAALGAIALTTLLTMPIAELDHERLSWTSWLGWPALLWHVLGATIIGAAIAATMLIGLFRDPLRTAMPIAWTAAATGTSSAIIAIAFMTAAPMTGQVADLLVVGWAGGTALWWTPWWHGRQTGKDDGPIDSATDLDWPDTREPVSTRAYRRAERARRRAAARAPSSVASRSGESPPAADTSASGAASPDPSPSLAGKTPDEVPERTLEREGVPN